MNFRVPQSEEEAADLLRSVVDDFASGREQFERFVSLLLLHAPNQTPDGKARLLSIVNRLRNEKGWGKHVGQ